MVQLIVGDKGKGKTKYLLDKVNAEVKERAHLDMVDFGGFPRINHLKLCI